MKDLVLNQVTMTSLEIAELTGKDHKNVIADIRKMLQELENLTADFSAVRKVRGKEYQIFNLPKRETLILVSGYSIELRAKIIDRWQQLEENLNLEKQRKADRQQARLEAPQMARALQEARARQGKESPSHVYSNDFDMINRIVLGLPAKKFKEVQGLEAEASLRDSLTPLQMSGFFNANHPYISIFNYSFKNLFRLDCFPQLFESLFWSIRMSYHIMRFSN